MSAPSNRIPVRPARGTRQILGIDIDKLQEGEIVFARDEDSLYVKDNGVLVNVGSGSGIGDQIVSAKLTWNVLLSDNSLYTFSGPGLDDSFELPTIYVIRGQKYKFVHDLSTDPFQITTTNGTPYNVGVLGNPAFESSIEWEVSMQAPQNLRYSSTTNSTVNQGNFIVISDTFTLAIEDLDNVNSADAVDGDVLIWSEAQQEWKPAQVTTGGTTNLAGLTDVNTDGVIQDDVLKYNGTFWVASPEATDPGTAGRKSTVAIDDTRSGQMLGTEFILNGTIDWTNLGFDIIGGASGAGVNDWISSNRITWLDNWSPLGRSDSGSYNEFFNFDGSGRLITFTNSPANHVPVSSTKKLSVPQNNALCYVAFLNASQTFIHQAGQQSVTIDDIEWEVIRIEYRKFDTYLAMEFWMSPEGHLKMLYGRPQDGFVLDAGPNGNGLVFASRSDDATLGDTNFVLPGLTSDGDYSIEFWYNGSGYNLDDLANVADSSTNPPRQNFPLVWDNGSWKPGSIVRDGAQASTSGGDLGIFAIDATYLYVCVAKNQWKRIPLESFV